MRRPSLLLITVILSSFAVAGATAATIVGVTALHHSTTASERAEDAAKQATEALGDVKRDENATRAKATHTAAVQKAGEPVAVCLLDAMKAVTPLLLKIPSVARPLESYSILQSHRYPGVICPTPAQAQKLVLASP